MYIVCDFYRKCQKSEKISRLTKVKEKKNCSYKIKYTLQEKKKSFVNESWFYVSSKRQEVRNGTTSRNLKEIAQNGLSIPMFKQEREHTSTDPHPLT